MFTSKSTAAFSKSDSCGHGQNNAASRLTSRTMKAAVNALKGLAGMFAVKTAAAGDFSSTLCPLL